MTIGCTLENGLFQQQKQEDKHAVLPGSDGDVQEVDPDEGHR